jgi:hypothetical protein
VTRAPAELWPTVHRLATGRDWPPRDEAEAAACIDYANGQLLLPLLLADDELPEIVKAAQVRYRAFAALHRKQYALRRAAIAELRRVLGADDLMLLKGADYCYRLYSQPGQRPMLDIDIYLPSARVPEAMDKLARAGHPRKYSRLGASLAPSHHEISLEIGGVLVEVHRHFSQRVRAGIDYAGIWQRRERFEADGIQACRAALADAILAQAFELAKDEFSSKLYRYVDFWLLLQCGAAELPTCVERAKAWGIERALFGALHVTSRLFRDAATPAVAAAVDRLLDPALRQYLVARVLPDPAVERSDHASGRVLQLRRKFALIDRGWRRLAFVCYHAYATAIGAVLEWQLRWRGHALPSRRALRKAGQG